MYKSEIKKIILSNNKKLHGVIQNNPMLKTRLIGWMKHEIFIENKILFPKDLYKNNYELKKEMDYTNLINQIKALDYIFNNLENKIDIIEIMNIHRILSEKTDIKGGILRRKEVLINKLNMCPPKPEFIIYKLKDLEFMLSDANKTPVETAIQAHYDIITIQPFEDFNKRTARLVMNWVLLQNNFCPVIFNKNSDNTKYRNALKNYKADYSEFMLSSISKTLIQMLKIIIR